jgi:hexosaminidase
MTTMKHDMLHHRTFFFLFLFSLFTFGLSAQIDTTGRLKAVPSSIKSNSSRTQPGQQPTSQRPDKGRPVNGPQGGGAIGRNNYNIVPYPTSLVPKPGTFTIAADVKIVADLTDSVTRNIVFGLSNRFYAIQGFKLEIVDLRDKRPTTRFILFEPRGQGKLGAEGYQMSVVFDRIIIRADAHAGYHYALQTLYQLLPPELFAFRRIEKSVVWDVYCCEIEDKPYKSYRGMHLDVSRHFFTVSEVKRYIDLLGMHKFNHFHWHLTDDQGWRVEIKKYPLLTQIGSRRENTLIDRPGVNVPDQFDAKPVVGFYTQEQIKEIVRYAQERFITIVPELDIPGHTQAAIAAYPQLQCDNKPDSKPIKVWNSWGQSEVALCPTDYTFRFLEDVFTELIALFPGQYIHIGGDEVLKSYWKDSPEAQRIMIQNGKPDDTDALQSYFVSRVAKFIQSKGRKVIGWDEILEGGLAKDAIVMSWRGEEGGIEAVNMGHQVIMTPGSHCYFDHYQENPQYEPLAIGGYTPIEKVYAYRPVPADIDDDRAGLVLGAQANLWTEYITSFDQLTYMAFPRAAALAEALWLPIKQRDFNEFRMRMRVQMRRYDTMGFKVAGHIMQPDWQVMPPKTPGQSPYLQFRNPFAKTNMRYTTDGQPVNPLSQLSNGTIPIDGDSKITIITYDESKPISQPLVLDIKSHLLLGYNPKSSPMCRSDYGRLTCLTDGMLGQKGRFLEERAVWKDTTIVLTYDLGSTPKVYQQLTITADINPWSQLLPPSVVLIETSADGISFTQAATQAVAVADYSQSGTETISIPLKKPFTDRYLRVQMSATSPCPKDTPCFDKKRSLSVREIALE